MPPATQPVTRPGLHTVTQPAGGSPARPTARFEPTPRMLLLLIAFIMAAGWYFWQINRDAPRFPAPLDEASVRIEMYLAIQGIERARQESGVVPRSLEELGVDGPGLTYEASAEGYQLIGSLSEGREPIRYRPGDDLEPYRAAFQLLQGAAR